jgi:hypothetical protein
MVLFFARVLCGISAPDYAFKAKPSRSECDALFREGRFLANTQGTISSLSMVASPFQVGLDYFLVAGTEGCPCGLSHTEIVRSADRGTMMKEDINEKLCAAVDWSGVFRHPESTILQSSLLRVYVAPLSDTPSFRRKPDSGCFWIPLYRVRGRLIKSGMTNGGGITRRLTTASRQG